MKDAQGWKLISEIGWGHKSTDYKALGRKWFKKLGKAKMKALRAFAGAKVSKLYEAVGEYERELKRNLEIGSDDGMNDLAWHVIGMGEKEFNLNLKNPTLLEDRYKNGGYKESFSYVFHEPEKPLTRQQEREREYNQMVEQADRLQQELSHALQEMNSLQVKIRHFKP
jgi:hypothetical protein